MSQAAYKPHYEHLKNKWTDLHRKTKNNLWDKHGHVLRDYAHRTKHMAIGTAGGLAMLLTPVPSLVSSQSAIPDPNLYTKELDKSVFNNAFMRKDLAQVVPKEVRELTPQEEASISAILTDRFGFPVSASLDGIRLNRSYGYIGAEQHLMRYPGDTMASHFQTPEEAALYGRSGMAPGRGAWGYFVQPGSEMTQKDIDREKYYIAVQTFLAPGYHGDVHRLYNFFKFRKMLVVNPENGKAMVVVIGDAGPAQWTGKHLGGSPEVMKYLERVDGRAKGPVLYFFIDDPEDKIPLGPVNVQ
jgi:hypothetical protein